MATNFPTGLDDFTNYVDGSTVMEAATLNDMQFAIEALQAKVGANSSGVSASHDYKLARTVNLGDAQTIAGVKTFNSFPVIATAAHPPTTDYQVADKKYVDDQGIGNYGTVTTITADVATTETNEIAPVQAATNLWVVANCSCTNDNRITVRGYTGTTSSPATFRQAMFLWSGFTTNIQADSFMMFVKNGEYYKVTAISQDGYKTGITRNYCTIPIGA
jgi:hypothetical protein